jgi:hypothetical protein
MASPQDWRDLRDRFAALPPPPLGRRSLSAILDNDQDADGIVRRWHLDAGSESVGREFVRLARAGARLLGYAARPKQDEWRDWLNSLRVEPLLSDYVEELTFLDDEQVGETHSWEIENVCEASAEFCMFLAGGAASGRLVTARPEPPSSDPRPCARRAAWLKRVLSELRVTPYQLWKVHGGPDRKTALRILAGVDVTDAVLDKLAIALTSAGRHTTVRDIPKD